MKTLKFIGALTGTLLVSALLVGGMVLTFKGCDDAAKASAKREAYLIKKSINDKQVAIEKEREFQLRLAKEAEQLKREKIQRDNQRETQDRIDLANRQREADRISIDYIQRGLEPPFSRLSAVSMKWHKDHPSEFDKALRRAVLEEQREAQEGKQWLKRNNYSK